MSFNLKGLFVTETEDKEVKEVKEVKTTSPKFAPTSLNSAFTAPQTKNFQTATATPSVESSSEFLQYLQDVYEKGNFPGPDYQEFIEGINSLANEPIDERTKFVTSFVGFKVQGVTKEKLIETAKKYISMIEAQRVEFKANVTNLLNSEVGNKQEKLKSLQDENTQIEEQMQQLTALKNKNNEQYQKLSLEINEDVQILQMKENGFEAAANVFIKNVNENINKIQQYLPATVTK